MMDYEVAGKGRPIILLHGFPLNNQIWTLVEGTLSKSCRVILPNLSGSGASSTKRMATDVLSLMDFLEVKQAVIVGHSMGGYVALALAQLAPDRVQGLVLMSTQARADTPEARKGRYDLAEKVAQEGSTVVASAMAPKLFGPAFDAERPLYRQVEQIMQSISPEDVRSHLAAMAERPDMRDFLSEITAKTLVLAGTEDKIFGPDRAEEMAAAIKEGTLKFIEGAGHMPMLEQPNITSDAILDWLQTV